jgi:hypothetical protein
MIVGSIEGGVTRGSRLDRWPHPALVCVTIVLATTLMAAATARLKKAKALRAKPCWL